MLDPKEVSWVMCAIRPPAVALESKLEIPNLPPREGSKLYLHDLATTRMLQVCFAVSHRQCMPDYANEEAKCCSAPELDRVDAKLTYDPQYLDLTVAFASSIQAPEAMTLVLTSLQEQPL